MSVKPEDKTLTYAQARDLKFFCQNVLGVRQDMYSVLDRVDGFNRRIARLEKTAALIEKFLGEKFEPIPTHEGKDVFDDERS